MRVSSFRRFSSYWWRDHFYLPVTVWYFLKRIWAYRELLWDDFEGDWIPILRLLQYKIRRNWEEMERGKVVEGWEKSVREQKVVDKLISRILKDKYISYEKYERP